MMTLEEIQSFEIYCSENGITIKQCLQEFGQLHQLTSRNHYVKPSLAIFSLDDSIRYWLFTDPTDVRKSFYMLSGIVNDQMSADLRNGDVFIFVNKNCNRIKLLRKEPGGLVIYAMILDMAVSACLQ